MEYNLYFALRGSELIIQARNAAQTLEVVPHDWFATDLPASLVAECSHWMNLSDGCIEIRPAGEIWQSSCTNWTLTPVEGGWNVRQSQRQLLDSQCRFYQMVTSALGPLDEKQNIVVTVSDEGQLEASLVRYNLKFLQKSCGALYCSKLEAKVDPNQSIGTFLGLQNFLVLKSTGSESQDFKREVIVPYGKTCLSRDAKQDHVSVQITLGLANSVRFFVYKLDTVLHRLNADVGLPRLYKAYLHALTSFVIPDPLTGRTGTEEALNCLRTEHLFAPPELDTEEVLQRLRDLSPKRDYYPEHLRVMQTIKWNDMLTGLSQHEEFEVIAQEIYESGARMAAFYGDRRQLFGTRSQDYLRSRAAARNAVYRVAKFGGERPSRTGDDRYHPRDRGPWGDRAHVIHELVTLIKQWRYSSSDVISDLAGFVKKLGTVGGYLRAVDWRNLSGLIGLQLAPSWGSLYNLCRGIDETRSAKLAFVFAMIAFGQPEILPLKTLIAISICGQFRGELRDQLGYALDRFNLNLGSAPSNDFLQLLRSCNSLPSPKWVGRNVLEYHRRQDEMEQEAIRIRDHLFAQWPCAEPRLPATSDCFYLHQLCEAVQQKFPTWHANKKFLEHVDSIQQALNIAATSTPVVSKNLEMVESKIHPLRIAPCAGPSLLDAVQGCDVDRSPPREIMFPLRQLQQAGTLDEIGELESILDDLRSSDAPYAKSLQTSLDAFKKASQFEALDKDLIDISNFRTNREEWIEHIHRIMQAICTNFERKNTKNLLLKTEQFEVRITVEEVLQLMRSRDTESRNHGFIFELGRAVSALQRCQRLICFIETGAIDNFVQEACNSGDRNWEVQDHPEWLALEIENDISMRPLQARVASEMIMPSTSGNALLQLNMGEGKSAVIIHMVAASLADSQDQLCRVLILKPLLKQMAALLAKRHSGIAARPLYHIPISRQTPLDDSLLAKLEQLWTECRAKGGILLVQPEHLMSLKLMGPAKLAAHPELGRRLISAFTAHQQQSRDILDESDEILTVTFQLVYATGAQRHFENHPERWTCHAFLLDLVEQAISQIKSAGAPGLTIDHDNDGGFPHISFAEYSVGDQLVRTIAHKIVECGAPRLNFETCDKAMKEMLFRCLTEADPSDSDWTKVHHDFTDGAFLNILVLRGLLAGGILLHCLRDKRWLVDYGLDATRSLLAVPYKAKRVPSPRSEFSHPDVAVMFTYLSYYYDGLTDSQLRQCFEILYRSPDPSQEYIAWVRRSSDLQTDLRDLSGVNLEDPSQFQDYLLPALRFNKKVIDFFAASIVFPREGKEFPFKLSTSAWDIPAEEDSPITTGFSGTNDNQCLLPRSIVQNDLPELAGTNAMVMSYLLRPENRACLTLCGQEEHSPSLEDLLDLMLQQEKRPQVLIDVGAFIIESRNEEVAISWLSKEPDMEMALFFDEKDEMILIDRQGVKERFLDSPYKDRLDKCLVYLDEFHTRGTDLKLPRQAKAAVTIARRISKDRLVQACMRMRKLGHGQSVFFIVNEEVHNKMNKSSESFPEMPFDSSDVLKFCLRETVAANDRLRPLWASHGISHRARQLALEEYLSSTAGEASANEKLVADLSERDAQSLTALYGPSKTHPDPPWMIPSDDALIQELQGVIRRLPSRDAAQSCLQEEQEREVDTEVQRIQIKERPPNMKPHKHSITPGLREVIASGRIEQPAHFYVAGQSLNRASFYNAGLLDRIFGLVYVTEDFYRTVVLERTDEQDSYLRPATFILLTSESPKLLIISPFEANELFDSIRQSEHTTLRIYAPRVMKSMRPVDRLGLHSIGGSPDLVSKPMSDALRLPLGLFAGQLYFETKADFQTIRKNLHQRLRTSQQRQMTPEAGLTAASDSSLSAILEETIKRLNHCLWQLISRHRKGKPFTATHAEALLLGRMLQEQDFDRSG